MKENIFTDKSLKPNNQLLSNALGKSFKLWNELLLSLEKDYGKLIEEWKYYGQMIGWTLKLFYKKRNLFFFTACNKYFRISFVFGNKAVNEIEKSDLPESIIDEVVNARKYAEGRGIRFEVRNKDDLVNIKKLVTIKIKN